MTVSPAILLQQPDLDEQQLAIISHGTGPSLTRAGPGSGKTACICLRALNLLLLGLVTPEYLLLCTFTRAAALEMQHRLVAGARAAGYPGNLSGLRVATIHRLCNQILEKHGRNAGLKMPNAVINTEDQLKLLLGDFAMIFGPDQDALVRHGWTTPQRIIQQAGRFFDRVGDELIDPQDLIDAGHPFRGALAHCHRRYRQLLNQRGLIDFAGLQTDALRLLEDPRVVSDYGETIDHLLVDEYQDTNHAQQRILFKLAETHRNICVVGDEDQLIYAFRGANRHGFEDFRNSFPEAATYELTSNFRSHAGIVKACNTWMESFDQNITVSGEALFRRPKSMEPQAAHANDGHPGVVSVTGSDRSDEAVRLSELLCLLKHQDFIGGYDEVAILLPSVKARHSAHYIQILRRAGIPIHLDRVEEAFGTIGHPRGGSANREPGWSQPAGHALLTTIHRAKGGEWPVICAAGLHVADLRPDELNIQLGPHLRRPSADLPDWSAEFDLARQYYVAFSRAQRLLVLTAAREPHQIFRQIWGDAVPREAIDPSRLTGRGKFSARRSHWSPTSGLHRRHLVVPTTSTLNVWAKFPGPPVLSFRT